MKTLMSRIVVLCVAGIATTAASGVATPERSGRAAASAPSRGTEQLADLLLNTPDLMTYGLEGYGAGMGLLDEAYEQGHWQFRRPVAATIIRYGPMLIPFCIAHLGDTRLTHAVYLTTARPQKYVRVPLGYVCLDLLVATMKPNGRILVEDCADDGLGACVREGYFFPPYAYDQYKSRLRAKPIVREVQENWRDALRRGDVQFGWQSANREATGYAPRRPPA